MKTVFFSVRQNRKSPEAFPADNNLPLRKVASKFPKTFRTEAGARVSG